MRTEEYPNGHPQMAQAAIQQGRTLAANFVRELRNEEKQPFVYKDLGSMATIGRNKAVADIFGLKLTGFIAWMIWMWVHLMSILGVRNKIATLVDWAWSYFTYDKSNRTIIAVKHPKVILQRNYDISMRHWGERSEEIAMDAARIYANRTKTSAEAEDDGDSVAEELARNALAKAAARLDAINNLSMEKAAAQSAKTSTNDEAKSTATERAEPKAADPAAQQQAADPAAQSGAAEPKAADKA